MKRNLLSLVLALTLSLSLAAPAVAAEAPAPEPPSLDAVQTLGQLGVLSAYDVDPAAWLAAHPDEAAAFDPHAYFAENYPYYDSEEEYMELWDLASQADFAENMKLEWAFDRAQIEADEAAWAQAQAQHPEETARFLAEFDGWFAGEYRWYGSLDAYCQDVGFTEGQALNYLFNEWKGQQDAEAAAQTQRDAFLTAHGGKPGQLNVMVNGVCLADAQPYAEDGVTYVSAKALNEALGTELKGDEQGFLALREAAQAAGCDVAWDAAYNTAVVTGMDALAAAADEDFTVANQLITGPMDGKTRTTTSKLDMDVTVFNSLDGDKTYRVTGKATAAIRDGSGSLSLELDLSGLAKLPGLSDLLASMLEDEMMSPLDLVKLGAAVKNFKLDAMLDRESGTMYLRSPLLAVLFPDQIGKDTWLSIPYTTDLTVGGMFLSTARIGAWSATPAEVWDKTLEGFAPIAALLGDQRFAPKGDGWDYTITKDDLTQLLAQLMPEPDGYYDPYAGMDWSTLFRDFEVDLHVKADGAVTGDYVMRPDYGAAMDALMPGMGPVMTTVMPMLDFQIQGTYKHSGTRQTSELTYHFKNTLELSLTATADTKVGGEAPARAPGDKDTVVSADQLG